MQIKLAILSIYLTFTLSGSVVSPIMPSISEHFQSSEFFAKLFLTIPSVVILPFLFISGFLNEYFSKKKLILTGLVLYLISGIGCIISITQAQMLFFRSLSGIGAGFILPFVVAFISDYFSGEEKDKIIKNSGIVNYLTAIFLLILTGMLTDIFWRLGFLVFFITLIPFFLVKTKVPIIKRNNKTKKYPFIYTLIFKPIVYKLAILYFIVMIFVFQYFLNISFFIIDNDLGTAYHSAMAQSFFMISAIISNMVMLYIIQNASNKMLYALQMLFISQGFFTLGGDNIDIYTVYFASFLLGLGHGSFYSAIILLLNSCTSKLNRVNAMSLILLSLYLAQFSSEFISIWIKNIFRISTFSGISLLQGSIFAIIAIGIFISFIRENRGKFFIRQD